MRVQFGNVRMSPGARVIPLLAILSIAPAFAAHVNSVVQILSTPNPVVQGQNVTFTVGVNWTSNALPTGSITLTDSCSGPQGTYVTTLGTAYLGSSTSPTPAAGIVIVSTFPCAGSNQITASYSGDTTYSPGISQPLIETVLSQAAPVTAALNSSQNPAQPNQDVTLTATLTYPFTNNSHATGSVVFTDMNSGKVLGTGTVQTVGSARFESTLATITLSQLAPGTYAVQAAYSGDNIYASSTSQILNQVVQNATPTASSTSLTSSATQATVGQPITFTTVVTSGAGTPTGFITFNDGSTILGTMNLDATGQAVLTTNSLAAGNHPITATYGGDTGFAGSTSAEVDVLMQPPTLASTTTAMGSSANPGVAGNTLTLIGTVSSSTSDTPTGTITFQDNSSGSAVVLATVPIQNGGASYDIAFPAGSYQLAAVYSGDGTFASSVGTLFQLINTPLAPTNISISSSASASTYGQTITFTAVVNGSSNVPTGIIVFNVGTLSAPMNVDSTGTATFTTSALAVGGTSVSAVYLGDTANAGGTSPTLIQTVAPASTEIAAVSSLNPSADGFPVTFTATLSVDAPGAGTPTGTVTFLLDNSTLCDSVGVDTNGMAACTTSAVAEGSHTLTTTYSGDGNFLSSTASLTQETIPSVTWVQLSVGETRLFYNDDSKLFHGKMTITNNTPSSVPGPIQAVFTHLPAGVTLMNPSGFLGGSPYLTLHGGRLNAGQSMTLALEFANPNFAVPSWVLQFYSAAAHKSVRSHSRLPERGR